MSEYELRNVDSSVPLMRTIQRSSNGHEDCSEYVDTDHGKVFVVLTGQPVRSGKPYIVTYHDLGLNYSSQFHSFFNFHDMKILLGAFTIVNIHAPGQEEDAQRLPDDYIYPNMNQLMEQVDSVCKYYGIVDFVGFGVGVGANVLSRFAISHPEMVDGLFLIHPTPSAIGWSDWLWQKWHFMHMPINESRFSLVTQDFLMWHHFGTINDERGNRDLIDTYRRYFSGESHNYRNFFLFLQSYLARTDLGIQRNLKAPSIKCPTIVLCGAHSPHIDDSVEMNGRIDPENTTWIKLQDSSMVLEEQPHKVFEAFKLFLQGIGHALVISQRASPPPAMLPLAGTTSGYNSGSSVHIVENPLNSEHH